MSSDKQPPFPFEVGLLGPLVKMFINGDTHRKWPLAEEIFTTTRRYLRSVPQSWRYGPDRILIVAPEHYKKITSTTSIKGKTMLDLGCGKFSPYGNLTYFYLNGIEKGYALDIETSDPERNAESLYDLLCHALAHPDRWKQDEVEETEYFERIRNFDLDALAVGDLAKGVANVPLEHIVCDIGACEQIQESSIDIMISQAVLEHFLDYKKAISRLWDIMSPEGIALHAIDLVDHRTYGDPVNYNAWSFLTKDNLGNENKVCNLLRSQDWLEIFETSGFELLDSEFWGHEMPDTVFKQLRPEFSKYSREELERTGVSALLKKPGKQKIVVDKENLNAQKQSIHPKPTELSISEEIQKILAK